MTRFLTAPIMYLLLGLLLAAGVFGGWQTFRLSAEKLSHQADLRKHADVLANIADLTAQAQAEYRALERSGEIATNTARSARQKEIDDGKLENARLSAAVASGERKLRALWTGNSCPAHQGADPDAADRAGESQALLQGQSIERIAGTLDEADSRIRFLLTRDAIWQGLCGGGQ